MSEAGCLRSVVGVVVTAYALLGQPSLSHAELIDDFNDGNDAGWLHVDGLQGTPWGPTIYDASSGQYAISSTSPLPPLGTLVPTGAVWSQSIYDPSYSNGSFRTLLHANNFATNLGTIMRFDVETADGYAFGVDVVADEIFIARLDGGMPTLIASAPFDLAPYRDYHLETHIAGPDFRPGANIWLKIWPAGAPEPPEPQLIATDATYMTGGFGLMLFNEMGGPGGQLSGYFDDVNYYVPEPTTLILLGFGMAACLRRRRA